MGLAEVKRKKKFIPSSKTASSWSSSAATSSIGFKLMSSMGWAPGKGLGYDLQGNHDNVKYSLKDDLLGIGAKKEYGGGLWRGTTEVDDLYRRLEVGSISSREHEEVKPEVKEVKEEAKCVGKWQMRFHVGDTYTSSFSESQSEVNTPQESSSNGDEANDGEVKQSKKRKRSEKKLEKKSKKRKTGESQGDEFYAKVCKTLSKN
jgi:Pin2-interacting protein X1